MRTKTKTEMKLFDRMVFAFLISLLVGLIWCALFGVPFADAQTIATVTNTITITPAPVSPTTSPASLYIIKKRAISTDAWTQIGTVSATPLDANGHVVYADTKNALGTQPQYVVAGQNSTGTGPDSNMVSCGAALPGGVTVTCQPIVVLGP